MRFYEKWWEKLLLFVLDKTDDDQQVIRKKTFFAVSLVLGPLCGAGIVRMNDKYSTIICSLGLTCSLVTIFVVLKLRVLTDTFVKAILWLFSACILIYDYSNAATMEDAMWPWFVLIFDWMLVLKVDRGNSEVLLGFIITYFVLDAVEKTYRFGFYDLDPDLEPDADYYTCDIGPPCPKAAFGTSSALASRLMVFIADWVCTRSFARRLYAEQARVHESIIIAEKVAVALTVFDLEAAHSHLIMSSASVPEDLAAALNTLLSNLRAYRPFLPQSVLPIGIDAEEVLTPLTPNVPEKTFDNCDPDSDSDTSVSISQTLSSSLHQAAVRKNIALLVTNLQNSSAMVLGTEVDPTAALSYLFGATVQLCNSMRGVLEVIQGDHTYCSFNVSLVCSDYAVAACRAAKCIAKQMSSDTTQLVSINIGVASGGCVCCMVGNSELKRSVIFGRMLHTVTWAERVGRLHNHMVVVDAATAERVEYRLQVRVVLVRVVSPALGKHLFSTVTCLSPDALTLSRTVVEEWMYQIQNAPQEWCTFNTVATKYLTSQPQQVPLDLRDDPRIESQELVYFISNQIEPHTLQLPW